MNRTSIIVVVALFVAFVAVAPAWAGEKKVETKKQLLSAYRLLRQGDEYGANKVFWALRKTLRVSGDKVTLRKIERVMVLIQRGKHMDARVRLKSLLR